jgi:hypothetical protein
MSTEMHALRSRVQQNCHISDAVHAADYSLCVYLLKMREYYRWEKGYGYDDVLSKDELGRWLTERERLWEHLEDRPFAPIELDGDQLDPFDADAINRRLLPIGMVYSAGLGRKTIPHFFLAKLDRRQEYQGFSVLVSSQEFARDLTAPPAMTLGKNIFVRRESVRRMIWEKAQESQWSNSDTPMARAMAYYDFETDTPGALEQMTDNELPGVLRHEMGEVQAGQLLGGKWSELQARVSRTKTEIMLRALRDHLADSLSTMPALLADFRPASLHFFIANLTAMRKELFPSLTQAYQEWLSTHELASLEELIECSADHWRTLGRTVIDLYESQGTEAIPTIEPLITNHKL